MKRLILTAFIAGFALTGCLSAPPKVPDAFREMFAPGFVMPKRSELSEKEVDQILSAFAAHRRPFELVVSIRLSSRDQVELAVRITPSMHGDGTAIFRKKEGRWVYDSTWYPV